jgi:hypothetical protein
MTKVATFTKDELRAELPDVADFVGLVREVFGDQIRVLGIRTPDWVMGKPDIVPGIRLSDCVWDAPAAPAAEPSPAERASRKRRRA